MSRFILLLFSLALLAAPAIAADDTPDPANLPEVERKGDSPAEHPAEMARRLRAGKALLEKLRQLRQ